MSAASIHESGYLEIGGIPQWVQIRGDDLANPLMLFLHGGPGGSACVLGTGWREWEKEFTIVHWDQRGAGRTFEKNGAKGGDLMTIGRMADEGLAVVEHLRKRLPGGRIVLAGHSWGTVLGVSMIRAKPEWFRAYVGIAQVTNTCRNGALRFEKLLVRLRTQGLEESVRQLEQIGPPPYGRDVLKRAAFQQVEDMISVDVVAPKLPRPLPPEIRPAEQEIIGKGMMYSRQQIMSNGEFERIDLAALGLRFELPLFFFSGTDDMITPFELAEEYCGLVEAPYKEFVRFDGEGHFFLFNAPDKFFAELRRRVRPQLG